MWQRAVIFPDPQTGWEWSQHTMLGLSHLVRVLITLQRAGIRDVILPPGSEALEPWLCTVQQHRSDLPALLWAGRDGWPDLMADAPVLGVQGGVLFTLSLLDWLRQMVGDAASGKAVMAARDTLPIVVSWLPSEVGSAGSEPLQIEDVASHMHQPAWCIPPDVFCQFVHVLAQPGGDRLLLATVGKATDRWHVTWVRGWTFPAIRWLAASSVTPNYITYAGFLVALIACWLIACGAYWTGIGGALLLYLSWVMDCMDGTMARLTYAESAFGQKLDTILGHLSNLAIFSALIWAVYGGEALWKVASVAFFLLGGILLAHWVSEREKVLRPRHGPSGQGKLHRFLDKINHRDYAVVIFALMVVRGLHVFLWLSLVGVQVYWLTLLVLLYRYRRRARDAVA